MKIFWRLAKKEFILKTGVILGLSNLLLPQARAQSFQGIVTSINGILNMVIPVLFLAASVVFLAGVVYFLSASGNEEKRTEGRTYMIWGLVGLFVMVAIWGIVALLTNFFFPGGLPSGPPNIPGFGNSINTGNSAVNQYIQNNPLNSSNNYGSGDICLQRDQNGNCIGWSD